MAEAICLVIDTGRTASQKPPDSPSFLEEALQCASLLVERKVFGESKDLVGVVLFGCQDTSNSLDYENIRVLDRGLAQADWETVTYLREHVVGTDLETDWLDALVVALDFLKVNSEGRKLTALKIVLFSELGTAADPDSLDLIIKGMNMLDNVDLTHIGPGWSDDDHNGNDDEPSNGHDDSNGAGPSNGHGERKSRYKLKPRTAEQKANETMMNQLVNETDGLMCSLELAVGQFLFKNKKGKKPFPWKVIWEIGPDIRIPVTGYVSIRREPPKSWKKCLARPGTGAQEGEELKPETSFVRNNETQDPVEPEELVSSYKYGPDMVIVSPADEEAAKFEGGPKSLKLFGFLNRGEIRHQDLVGDGIMIFVPVDGDENSLVAVSTLVQAMVEMGMVAVVRKVYNKASTPRLGILVPETDGDDQIYLSYIELPYAEDVRELSFAPLPEPNDEQMSVMDDLIDAMMLEGEPGSGIDLLRTEEMLNPAFQYFYQCLRARALKPGRVLPPPDSHVADLLGLPPAVERGMVEMEGKLRKIFPTKQVEKFKKGVKRTAEDVFGKDVNVKSDDDENKKSKLYDLELGSGSTVTEVGTVTPVEDFRHLLSTSVTSRVTLDMVAQQLENVTMRMLASAFGSDVNTKVVRCLTVYREEVVIHQRPQLYNSFIKRVKEAVMGSKGDSKLWLEVAEANLGLIADSEVAGGVAEKEADTFLLPPEENNVPDEMDDEDEDLLDML